MMIDIDHFKDFNDQYGHRIGDAVLSNVAQEANKCIRETDLFARYGGEEFSLILPTAALHEAEKAAERILKTISEIKHTIDGQHLSVTVSVGVAGAVKGDDADSLVHKADDALYAAKHNGRNRVYIHDGKTCVPLGNPEPDERKISSFRGWRDSVPIEQARIAIVDDEPAIIALSQKYLRDAGYENFLPIACAKDAVSTIYRESPDLVLLDIHMPEVDGLTILNQLRNSNRTKRLPVLIFTSATDHETKVKALSLEANDFLAKPIHPAELTARVRTTLLAKSHMDRLADYSHDLENKVRERTSELAQSRRYAIQCLARAAELRDDQTGQHVLRVGRYAALIADELGFSRDRVTAIEQAAQLHDVGKIGIPDAILRKPGELTPQEYASMKDHCVMGNRVLLGEDIFQENTGDFPAACENGTFSSSVMELAASIAATHHEKWDGTGYPRGLAGKTIPIEGRITAVADVFDALSTQRSYKKAFDLGKCFLIMEQNRGTQFDPNVLDAFFRRRSEIERTIQEYANSRNVASKFSRGANRTGRERRQRAPAVKSGRRSEHLR